VNGFAYYRFSQTTAGTYAGEKRWAENWGHSKRSIRREKLKAERKLLNKKKRMRGKKEKIRRGRVKGLLPLESWGDA